MDCIPTDLIWGGRISQCDEILTFESVRGWFACGGGERLGTGTVEREGFLDATARVWDVTRPIRVLVGGAGVVVARSGERPVPHMPLSCRKDNVTARPHIAFVMFGVQAFRFCAPAGCPSAPVR